MNSEPDPVYDFPVAFPLRVIGRADEALLPALLEIVVRYVPELTEQAFSVRPSSGGKYLAVTITFTAQNRGQLEAIYTDLAAHELVIMTL